MIIRQEVWTPKTSWKTALNQGYTSRSGVVFCFGNPGKHNAQAIFNEVRHSFPEAELVFGFLDEGHDEQLFLTAFHCEPEQFVIDKIELNNLAEDSQAIKDRFEEIKWNERMLCLDADQSYARQLVSNIQENCSTNQILQSQKPTQRIRLGLNEMPEYNRAISFVMKDQSFNFSIKKPAALASKGAAATQSIWDRYAVYMQTASENYTFHLPIALISV